MEKGDKNKNESWWKPGVDIFGQVSAWVVVPIVTALVAGKWLDGLYGTKPWLFLALSGIGFLISLFGIVLTVSKYIRNLTKTKEEKNGKPDDSK